MPDILHIITSYVLYGYVRLLDRLETLAYYQDTPLVVLLLVLAIIILGGFLAVIIAAVVIQRLYNNRTSAMMRQLGQAFDLMMQGRTTEEIDGDQIRTVLCRKHFIYFERYLRNAVSTTGEIDTEGLRRIARISGFSAFIRRRVRRKRGWNRALALRTLTYLRDPDDVPLYLELLERTRQAPVAYAAALGLALTRSYDALDIIIRKTYTPAEPNRDIILTVLEAYGPGVCPMVQKLLGKTEYCGTVRTILLDYLRVHEYKPAAAAVEALFGEDTTEEVRIHAIETLGIIGTRESARFLISPLSDPSFIVRLKALVAMARLDWEKALPFLEEAMQDKDWWVRRNAAEALLHHEKGGDAVLERFAARPDSPGGKTARMVLAEKMQSRNRMRYRFA